MKRGLIFLMIVMLLISCNLLAQNQGKRYYITGKVIDINDRPVSGAILLVDDLNTQVVTDDGGMFKIRVKKDADRLAVFTPIYGQSEEVINGRKVINFRLTKGISLQTEDKQGNPDNDQVNIAYGSASKKNLTTSVRRIDSKNKNYQNIYELLQEDPSIQVNGNKIVIRGVNSINNTDPLLIVDGIIVSSIDDISPQMVKSIEILKGSDAAIYGSRGANGVVMITLIGAGNK